MRKWILVLLAFVALAIACTKEDKTQDGPDPQPENPGEQMEVVRAEKPKFVFGFSGQNRYSYCPSSVEGADGVSHLWFCGNPNADVMVDNVYHIKLDRSYNYSALQSVLQPGSDGSWDDHHTCDPSVIEGQFLFSGQNYRYALFFLSNANGVYYNEIGVAFSNSLDAISWKKYPEQIVYKTWSESGDQLLSGGAKSWGVGQPSAVSLDGKGKVLLTYTIGDKTGTYVAFQELEMSDMSNLQMGPVKRIVETGLLKSSGKQDYTCDADFAINGEKDMIVMIRPIGDPVSEYPAYIPVAQEIDYMPLSDFLGLRGSWTPLFKVDSAFSGFPRNHNAALERDSFGHISDPLNPGFFYTVSKASPDVSASQGKHAEWTYHIYHSKVYHTMVSIGGK